MKGYVLGYAFRLRAPDRDRGHATRALEVAGEGPGIVLLHGWSDSADTWRPLLAQLGARGRRAIAVDLPGLRRGDPAARRRRASPARRLRERWSSLGRREPVVVAGACLGGCLALRLAEHPGDARARGRRAGRPGRARAAGLVRPDRGGPARPPAAVDPDPGSGRARPPRPASAHRQLAFSHPSDAQRASSRPFGRDGETRADLAALLNPAASSLRNSPPRRSTSSASAARCCSCGARMTAMLPHSDARMALDALPTTQVELIEDCGPSPAARGDRPSAELLLPFGT